MPSKRCFFVLGAESSGTHLATRLLEAAGCTEVGQTTDMPFGDGDLPDTVVWRRSIPHGWTGNERSWPDILALFAYAHKHGYQVRVLVTMRDWHSMVSSQVRRGHAHSPAEAIEQTCRAYLEIFAALDLDRERMPYFVLSYDNLVLRPNAAAYAMLRVLGLPLIHLPEAIYDGNQQYYR